MSDFAEWRPCRVCGLPVALPKRTHDECREEQEPDAPESDDERMNLAALTGVIWGMFSAREHDGLYRAHPGGAVDVSGNDAEFYVIVTALATGNRYRVTVTPEPLPDEHSARLNVYGQWETLTVENLARLLIWSGLSFDTYIYMLQASFA